MAERNVNDNPEPNRAQRDSDAAPGVVAGERATRRNRNTSDASGIPADSDRAGEIRKRLHEQGFDPNVG